MLSIEQKYTFEKVVILTAIADDVLLMLRYRHVLLAIADATETLSEVECKGER